VTRLVVLNVVLLALEAAYVAWVSRVERGSRINLFVGRRPAGRERWVGAAVYGVVLAGLLFGTDSYGWGTRWVNLLVFVAALSALSLGVQLVHNRAVARR